MKMGHIYKSSESTKIQKTSEVSWRITWNKSQIYKINKGVKLNTLCIYAGIPQGNNYHLDYRNVPQYFKNPYEKFP
jgi:hypothetical protein